MYTALGTAFPDTAMALDFMYNCCFNVRELEMRVQHVAQGLNVARSRGRTQEYYRDWLNEH
jgi:hypothetical protein